VGGILLRSLHYLEDNRVKVFGWHTQINLKNAQTNLQNSILIKTDNRGTALRVLFKTPQPYKPFLRSHTTEQKRLF